MATKRILIADDHPVFRRGLRQAIEEQSGSWLVTEAGDGEEAIRLCKSEKLDVAIFDFSMPKLDGLAAIRLLRKDNLDLRTIMLTMHDDLELIDEAMNLGVQAFVLKDDDIEDILLALQLVITGKKYISPTLYARPRAEEQNARDFNGKEAELEQLTQTEKTILRLIAKDLTSKEIATELECSIHTVNTHRQNMSTKLQLNGSHSLLRFAYQAFGKILRLPERDESGGASTPCAKARKPSRAT